MDAEMFNLEEHLPSIQWMEELPKGLVSKSIDTRIYIVNIKSGDGGSFEIYIGPNSMAGGDAISVIVDSEGKLVKYVMERVEPEPDFGDE